MLPHTAAQMKSIYSYYRLKSSQTCSLHSACAKTLECNVEMQGKNPVDMHLRVVRFHWI